MPQYALPSEQTSTILNKREHFLTLVNTLNAYCRTEGSNPSLSATCLSRTYVGCMPSVCLGAVFLRAAELPLQADFQPVSLTSLLLGGLFIGLVLLLACGFALWLRQSRRFDWRRRLQASARVPKSTPVWSGPRPTVEKGMVICGPCGRAVPVIVPYGLQVVPVRRKFLAGLFLCQHFELRRRRKAGVR